jgi:hypothetical protein
MLVSLETITSLGLARCPFAKEDYHTKDGRSTVISNSPFGTVYSSSAAITASATCSHSASWLESLHRLCFS